MSYGIVSPLYQCFHQVTVPKRYCYQENVPTMFATLIKRREILDCIIDLLTYIAPWNVDKFSQRVKGNCWKILANCTYQTFDHR